jgi:hypothetical protein
VIIPAESATQGGCFTFPQAWAVGWTYKLLASAVRREQLHQVRRRVWIEKPLWDALDDRGQHLVKVRADLLVLPSGWYTARRSAAVAMELPLIGDLPTVPQLVSCKATHAANRHRKVAKVPAAHLVARDAVPLTSLSWTAMDLARKESFLSAVVVADAVLGLGVPRQSLMDVLDEMARWPGLERAREVAAFADGLSESALESLSRVRCLERGLPPPELQVEVWRGPKLLGRVDKLWRAQRVIGEDDGMAKFGDTAGERQESFKATYQRGLDLQDGGLELARWDWNAAWRDGGALVEERVRKAFLKAERSVLDPDIRFVSTTVEDRLRRNRRAS